MNAKKPVRKPHLEHGCESCEYRFEDFENDSENPNLIRCYCKARHFKVDAELMSKEGCDFYRLSPAYERPKEDSSKYGL